MEFIDIPTEQTTATTDLAIALLAIAGGVYLKGKGPRGLRGRLWRTVFGLLAVAGLLGAVGHGFVLGETAETGIWRVLYLVLALLVAAFLLATVRDLAGDVRARQALPVLAALALAFYAFALVDPDTFLPFILYELTAMTLALTGFVWMTIKGTRPGAVWISAAIATNIAAAAIQATRSVSFTLIWTFDHNGAFHLVQILGIALLVKGLRSGGRV